MGAVLDFFDKPNKLTIRIFLELDIGDFLEKSADKFCKNLARKTGTLNSF